MQGDMGTVGALLLLSMEISPQLDQPAEHLANREALSTPWRKFPQITLTDALRLPEMDSRTWKHVVPSDHSKDRIITRVGELRLIKQFGGAVWLTEIDHLSIPSYQAYMDNTCTKAGVPICYLVMVRSWV
jgi:hypothetical protein